MFQPRFTSFLQPKLIKDMAEPSNEGFSRPSAYFTFEIPNHVTLSRRQGVRVECEGMICHHILFSTGDTHGLARYRYELHLSGYFDASQKVKRSDKRDCLIRQATQQEQKSWHLHPLAFSHHPLSMSILVQKPGFMMKRGVRLS